MPMTPKFRKWHFLLLGSVLILLSLYLWYWNWRKLGIPYTLQPENYITFAAFIVGILVLGVFVYRLTRQQVTVMLLYMILVNLIFALVSVWIFRTFPDIFHILSPNHLPDYDAAYLEEWREIFLTPALYMLHSGLLFIWLSSLVMFSVRKPGEQPG